MTLVFVSLINLAASSKTTPQKQLYSLCELAVLKPSTLVIIFPVCKLKFGVSSTDQASAWEQTPYAPEDNT